MGWIDADAYLRLVRGRTRGPAATLARLGLGAAAAAYGLGVAARNAAFDRGWKRSHRAGVPVVSVGNITLGGTGKTPMVEWVARWYRRRGLRVAVLSRGYGHSGGVNDEAMVLEENLPDVPHLQDPDRVKLAAIAVAELETELIVLDDGFQHRRLARDLDLVMIDALDPFGLGRLFPRGLLREPVGSLRRASAVILSRADLLGPAEREAIRKTVHHSAPGAAFVESRHAPLDLIDGDGQVAPVEDLAGKDVAAFCGIGNPEGFRRTLQPLCRQVLDLRVFPDHHPYTAADVGSLAGWARDLRANLALTTQKDLVKLRTASLGPVPLRALRIGLEITDGLDALEKVLDALVAGFVSRSRASSCRKTHPPSRSQWSDWSVRLPDEDRGILPQPDRRHRHGDADVPGPETPVPRGPADRGRPAPGRTRARRLRLVRRDHPVAPPVAPARSARAAKSSAGCARRVMTSRSSCPTRSASPGWPGLRGSPGASATCRYGRGLLLTEGLQPPRDAEGRFLPTPIVGYYLALARLLGCRCDSDRLELGTTPQDESAADRAWADLGLRAEQPVVCLNTGGAFGPAKNWPTPSFAELARRLVTERSASVLVLCGPAEREPAREIARLAGHPAVVSLADHPPSLGLSKACVRRAALLITTDSGPRHFAAAFQTPVITLFGPTHIAWTRTYHPHAIHLFQPVPCGPCQRPVCPEGHHRCMRELSPDQVLQAAFRFLPAVRPAGGSTPHLPRAGTAPGAVGPGRRRLFFSETGGEA